MIGSLYRPGASPLHRASPGGKLAALALCGTLVVLVGDPLLMVALFCLSLALFRAADFSLVTALRQMRPALPVLAVLFLFQLWAVDVSAAALVVLRLGTLLLLAALVTLTTRVSDMTETLERALGPFRRFGIDPERVGLAISLAIRFLPALGSVLAEVREAQRARGLDRSMLALLVPLLLRTLKMADEVAEAIDARS
ncbi:energy-coupling factor transporter transmembrane protein EcfT [Aureimonas sp. AU20]|uniref:energy-coupling factor transporter transmembrane component T family protein n=1 Tax=Aureimonas sp. AU20 TaxID=1349819 RepID=UPI00072015AB|nr:energy-coupling factor transporter transmembrane protein EcfT [Aureimonas sp. AU20]ALN73685.1 hypothetical protein M673_13230 [Aureimonas sp. AU20]